MKKIQFILFCCSFIFFCNFGTAQNKDCKKFKNGTFKLVDKNSGTTYIIKRKGDIQYEEIEGDSKQFSFHIKWINDCKYTVLPTKETMDYDARFAGLLVIEIIEVRDKSYIMRATIPDNPDFVKENEMILIE